MTTHADRIREAERAALDHITGDAPSVSGMWAHRKALIALRAECCQACEGKGKMPLWDPGDRLCPAGCDNGRMRA